MPIIYVQGDIFEAATTVIAHGCNCRGAMGRGIAKKMRQLYPVMYQVYHQHCIDGLFRPGMVWPYQAIDGRIIFNLATQDDWGTHAVQARPEWIQECVFKMVRWCIAHDIFEATIPRLGCGLGGLRWEVVEPRVAEALHEATSSMPPVWFNLYVTQMKGED